jgi:hypothetical protein
LSDKSNLKTIKDVAVNTGLALALKGIYDSGDASAGLTQMMKFVTSAEATELSIAAAITYRILLSYHAIVRRCLAAAPTINARECAVKSSSPALMTLRLANFASMMRAGTSKKTQVLFISFDTRPSFQVSRVTIHPSSDAVV